MYINIHVCKTKEKIGCEFERQQWGRYGEVWGEESEVGIMQF